MSAAPTDPLRQRILESFGRQTFMRHLGADLGKVSRGEVEISLRRDERLLQQHGFLHAGVITSILDSACGYAAGTIMEPGEEVLSVEFKTNLLAPASGRSFLARGTVINAGKTLVVCRGEAFAVDGEQPRLVAAMQATMMRRGSGETARGPEG
jgi:uncharacterized protein (TIGR00369 family)